MNLLKQLAIICMMILVFALPTDGLVDIAGMSLVKIFGLLGFGLTVVLLLTGGTLKGNPIFYSAVLLYIAWVVFSYLWTVMPVDYVNEQTVSSQQTIKAHLYIIVLIALLFQLVEQPQDLNRLAVSFLAGSLWLALLLLRDYDPSGSTVRNQIVNFDSNEVSVKLMMGVPLAAYVFVQMRSGLLRWIPLLYVPIAFFAVLSTGSRTGAILMLISLLSFVPVLLRAGFVIKTLSLVGLAASLVVAMNMIPERTMERILSAGTEISSGTLNERSIIWAKAYQEWETSPVYGQGVGSFRRIVNKYNVDYTAHNSYVAIAVEQGIIGLVLYLAVLMIAVVYALKQSKGMGLAMLSLLTVVALGQMSLTLHDRMHIWFAYAFVVIAFHLYEKEQYHQYDTQEMSMPLQPLPGGISPYR